MKCNICFIETSGESCEDCNARKFNIKSRCFICLKPMPNHTLKEYISHGNACMPCNVRASNVVADPNYKQAMIDADEEIKKLRRKYGKFKKQLR